MNLIAFAGPKHIGKTTARNAVMQLGKHPVHLSFANPIKRALLAMGFTREELFFQKETTIPEVGKPPRVLMQTLGTDWGRNMINKDLWLILFAREIRSQTTQGTDLVVVDDVRYDNEAAAVKALGGHVVQIKCLVRGEERGDSHSSERGIDSRFVDHIVYNDGTEDEFITTVRQLVHNILQPEVSDV